MLSIKEFLKPGVSFSSLPSEVQVNLLELCKRINTVRQIYGKPMTVTSGLRTMAEHLAIYKAKGITDQSRIPMKSKHLSGEAVDISDPKRELQAWCKANVAVLEAANLWCEDFSATPNWVHFQSIAPKSGKRFFMP